MTTDDSDDSSLMVQVTSQKQLSELIQEKEVIVLKFTAEWCKPCKMIQPFYEKLATLHSSSKVMFGIVDVDEADDVACEFKVAMMPTFVAIHGGNVVQTISGVNEGKLEDLVKQVLVL
jgi:thioredoxin 1